MAEREGVDISGDDGDREQTARRTIRDQYYGRKRAEEGHQRMTAKEAFCYDDDGMVAYTDPGWIHSEFDTLTGLPDRVVLRTNVRKTVEIVFRPCWAAGVWSDEAYTRRIT